MFSEITNHIHPILVHFPIALIIIGLCYDLVLAVKNRSLLPKQGAWLWVIAAAGAWLAVLTGPEEDARGNTTYLDIHSTLADFTAWVVTVLALWRLWQIIRGNKPFVKTFLVAYLVLSIASGALVLGTGYYGGKMVYTDGVGVKANGTMVNPPKP
ncbi:DUF2231 domain-containing protein [Gorillibacterium massiliense]|uniref:DUF2231 domain-containing protein n=1 Tax=Gorillibacterium massiliense TaxID=1280390 RepID=UPI0004B98B29|nr:DUF2231 domain-containing protein [Gorillibacterium massiliense]